MAGAGDEEGRKGKEQVFFHVEGLIAAGHLGNWTLWLLRLERAWAPVLGGIYPVSSCTAEKAAGKWDAWQSSSVPSDCTSPRD